MININPKILIPIECDWICLDSFLKKILSIPRAQHTSLQSNFVFMCIKLEYFMISFRNLNFYFCCIMCIYFFYYEKHSNKICIFIDKSEKIIGTQLYSESILWWTNEYIKNWNLIGFNSFFAHKAFILNNVWEK